MDESTPHGGAARLPETLHGRLFLLAHHRRRHRFGGERPPRYGLALRTAMLCDLYLSGHLADDEGTPKANAINAIDDELLRELFDQICAGEYEDWADATLRGSYAVTPAAVESQLADVWRRSEQHRVLGKLVRTRLRLTNPGLVDALADDVAHAVDAAIDGQPTDDRLLTIGLIGALGQLPTVLSFTPASRYHDLHRLVYAGIPPLKGFLDVVELFRWTVKSKYENESRRNAG